MATVIANVLVGEVAIKDDHLVMRRVNPVSLLARTAYRASRGERPPAPAFPEPTRSEVTYRVLPSDEAPFVASDGSVQGQGLQYAFCSLAQKPDSAILRFARRWGLLAAGALPAPSDPDEELRESLALWRDKARELRSAVALWRAVGDGDEAACRHAAADLRPDLGLLRPDLGFTAGVVVARTILEGMLNTRTGATHVVFRVAPDGEWTMGYRSTTLLGALWLMLALDVAGGRRVAVCACECGDFFEQTHGNQRFRPGHSGKARVRRHRERHRPGGRGE